MLTLFWAPKRTLYLIFCFHLLYRLSVEQVAPYAEQMLSALFAAFKHPDSSENEYLMKAVMRLISFLGPGMSPVAPMCLQVGGLGLEEGEGTLKVDKG